MNDSVERLKENREFRGIWIPKEIWFDDNLDAIEKCILVEIDSLDNENHCVASNNYFAHFIGCSESKVSKSISKLIDLGYVKQVHFDGRIRILSSNIKYSIKEK